MRHQCDVFNVLKVSPKLWLTMTALRPNARLVVIQTSADFSRIGAIVQ
jgi:hypothetical protein